jgi:tetratricopeptide (TPR) repeat protein
MLFASNALAADDSQAAVIDLNNQGVIELTAGHYAMAIKNFESALKLDRNYELARDNLAIAFNNEGLAERGHPKDALKLFHRAMLINEDSPTTRQNMAGILRVMGRNPSDYQERISQAESALHLGDYIDAAVEYGEALRLHEDQDIRNKRDDLLDTLDDSCLFFRRKNDDDEQLAKRVVVKEAVENKTPDFEYINNLERRINRRWRPPEAAKSTNMTQTRT